MLCSYHTVTEPVIVWGLSTYPIRILGDYADLAVTPVPSRCSFEWLARERGTMDKLTCVLFPRDHAAGGLYKRHRQVLNMRCCV